MSSHEDRLKEADRTFVPPTMDDLLTPGDLFAREPPTPEGEADMEAGIDETPDDVDPEEAEIPYPLNAANAWKPRRRR
jgi:hypothetical protein